MSNLLKNCGRNRKIDNFLFNNILYIRKLTPIFIVSMQIIILVLLVKNFFNQSVFVVVFKIDKKD